jgi:hypothetical protein
MGLSPTKKDSPYLANLLWNNNLEQIVGAGAGTLLVLLTQVKTRFFLPRLKKYR